MRHKYWVVAATSNIPAPALPYLLSLPTCLLACLQSKMRSGAIVAVLLVVVCAAFFTKGQELNVPEREAVATLAAHILKVVHAPPEVVGSLPHKRNSEIINSLLGISRLMNEAGRR
ncbi:pigment-dispersing hormone 2 peptides-like [Scylla paramamosain]|uniref:pigment-dispersing hormone 2 peptides-like n=1 Tax=Scylla paramamosain TaxID=85552 RepID=UPI0030830B92